MFLNLELFLTLSHRTKSILNTVGQDQKGAVLGDQQSYTSYRASY